MYRRFNTGKFSIMYLTVLLNLVVDLLAMHGTLDVNLVSVKFSIVHRY
eukprot:SAG11_NODE_2317_length_3530_cov_31.020111_2_plen_48_part_00